MSNHKQQILSKEDTEIDTSKAFAKAQAQLRASIQAFNPDNSLPWERREQYIDPPIPENDYTEEEVQEHIDSYRLFMLEVVQTRTHILENYTDKELQTHIDICQHELEEREEVKKNQEEGKAQKSEHQTPKWKLYIAEEESYKQQRKKQQLREQLRKKQKLDHSDTNKNSTK